MEQQMNQLEPLADDELDVAVAVDSGSDANEIWGVLCSSRLLN